MRQSLRDRSTWRRPARPPTVHTLLAAKSGNVHTILWVIAVVLVIAGIIAILRRSIIFGIVLIIAGFLVGPGGVSIFK